MWWLDLIGSILSLLATVLFIIPHILAWPISLAAIIINFILFYQMGIYGDMFLEVILAWTIIVGWYRWSRLDTKNETMINDDKLFTLKILAIATLILPGFIALLFFFGSTIPYLDGIASVYGASAMILSTRKIIWHWVIWFCVDILFVSIYVIKGLPSHTLLYGLYTVMAIIGYFNWYRLMHRHARLIPLSA